MTSQTPVIMHSGQGEHFHFLGSLTTNKLATDKPAEQGRGGSMSVFETVSPQGFSPPLHRHDLEDELFYLIDGEVRFLAGDVDVVAAAGATIWMPKQLPHQFQVLSPTARFFQVTVPGQFHAFVSVLGSPTADTTLPEQQEIDPAHVAKVCADFDIQVLGPPLPPLPVG